MVILKKTKFLTALIISLVILFLPGIAGASTSVNLFQITTDGSQQKDAFVFKDLVAYTNFGGSQGIDIWGYDLNNGNNFPIIERPGQQFLTGLFGNLLVYEDVDDSSNYDVRLHNFRTGKDELVAGDEGAQTSGVTNGKYVIYINGGACGTLHAYNIRKKTTSQISNTACHPVRVSGGIVVWSYAAPGGTNVYGYNLDKEESFDIATDADFQEVPNIFGNNVVWHHYITGAYGDYEAIKMKSLRTGEVKTLYETNTDSLGSSAISNRYVVWSQSPSQHVNKVMGADLKTGEVFEVQSAGNHQNSHTTPSIWRDTAAWGSFRTGNGDIYAGEFSR